MANHPSVFIGLGGAGSVTVAQVKRLLLKALGPVELAKYYRFLLFDTNKTEFDTIKTLLDQEFKVDPNFIKAQVEWFPIGNFNPYVFAMESLRGTKEVDKDIQRWLDPQSAKTFPNKLADDGAGGDRQRGRLCFAMNYKTFDTNITAATTQLNDLKDGNQGREPVHYWVVTGSCGGTGSSVFYDVLYHICMRYYASIAQATPILRPVIYSPNPYIDMFRSRNEEELEKRFSANAYAFFLELQRAINRYHTGGVGAAEEFALPSQIPPIFRGQNWRPFETALIVDTACEDQISFIPFQQLYGTTAEMIAYNVLTGADAKLNSWWMNATPQQDPDTGTWEYWNASGFRAVEYPSKPLLDYTANRYFSDLLKFYVAPNKKVGEKELSTRSEEMVETVVLEPFGPSPIGRTKSAPVSAQSFRALVEKEHLGSRARKWGLVDEFCRADSNKPDSAPIIDPSALTIDSLRASMGRLLEDIKSMKGGIRKDFISRFGGPATARQGEYYANLGHKLWERFEDYLEQEGICTLIGPPESLDSGLVPRLMSMVMERKSTLETALETSNKKVDELRAGPKGLDRLMIEVAEEAEKQGGIGGVFRSGKGLRERLEVFARRRRELIEEAFNNQLLMLEIEVLNYVGSPDTPVRFAEWFTSQQDVSSLLARLKDQAIRIRSWLGRAASESDKRLQKEKNDLHRQHRDVITRYMPGSESIEINGVIGELAKETLAHLKGIDKTIGGRRLRAFTSLAGNKAYSWAEIRPTESDESPEAGARFWEGASKWVQDQFETDPTLKSKANMSLAGYVGADPGRQQAIQDQLNADNVLVFSKVNPKVKTNSPIYRLVVTATPQSESFTQTVGVGPSEAHLQDPSAPWRAVVVKYYTRLCLEKAFPMFQSLGAVYEQYTQYEPHLRRDGRAFYQEGSRAAWEYAFSLGVAWAWMLGQGRWKSEPELRRLFSKKLDYQPDAFLEGGPIKLENRTYYLLEAELQDSMINTAGELEFSLPGAGYHKCGSVTEAWRMVLKSQKALSNLKFFNRELGGVDFVWTEDQEVPLAQIVHRDRAETLHVSLGKFRDVLHNRIAEMDRQVKPQLAEVADRQTFGLIMNAVVDMERQIKAALAGDGSPLL